MDRAELSPKAWVALLAVYTIWGSTYLAIRVLIETIPPFLGASARWLVAGGIMFGVGSWSARGEERPTMQQWRSTAIIGTALVFGGNGLVSVAEHRIASGTAALLVATVPLFVASFSWIQTRRSLPRAVLAGLIAGFAGTAILVRPQTGEGAIDSIGALTVLAASMSWALGSIYARHASLPSRPAVATGMEMLAGGAVLAIVGLLGGEAGRIHPTSISASSLMALGYLIVFGSLGGFSAYLWLLRNVRTSIATTYAYVNPLVAVILGWLILDELVTASIVIGGAVIVGAVATIVVASARESKREREAVGREDLAAQELPI
jgi:drug/metabolite transporter (DMT)-like permease